MNCLSRKLFKSPLKLIVLILCVSMVTSCEKPPKVEPHSDINLDKLDDHLITAKKAVEMRNSYKTDRIDLLRGKLKDMYGPEFEDTRTVWFDYETIRSYVHYVEERSKANDVKMDGILMYFGVNDSSAKYKNQQSIFLAPTTKTENGHAGFTLEKIGGEIQVVYLKDRQKLDQSQDPKQENRASFFNFSPPPGDEDGLILNLGTSSPPEDNN